MTRFAPEIEAEQDVDRTRERPASEPKSGPGALHAEATRAADTRLVLILEDDVLAARLLDAMFRRTPGTQTECLSHLDAIQRRVGEIGGDRDAPDLVIVDLGLPRDAGVEIVKQLRAAPGLEHLPVIVLTGCNDTQSVRSARAAGATAVYSKQDVARHIARWTRDILALTDRAQAA